MELDDCCCCWHEQIICCFLIVIIVVGHQNENKTQGEHEDSSGHDCYYFRFWKFDKDRYCVHHHSLEENTVLSHLCKGLCGLEQGCGPCCSVFCIGSAHRQQNCRFFFLCFILLLLGRYFLTWLYSMAVVGTAAQNLLSRTFDCNDLCALQHRQNRQASER